MSAWTVIPLSKSLGSHAADWDHLNRAAFDSHPLLSSLFVEGLLSRFGNGNEYLCVRGDHGAPRAMVVVQRQSRFSWRSFTPSQAQVAPTLIPEREMLDGLLQSLPGHALQLDLLCNDPQVGGVLHDSGPPVQRMVHTLTMHVDLVGSFEDYWAQRPRQLAKNMRRYERRAVEEGLTPKIVHLTTPEEVEAGVARYAALEGAGWKGKRGTALGSTPEQYGFFWNLMRESAANGVAIVYELWLGDQLAASRLVLRGPRMLVILKTSYNENLARHAPGRLLLRAVIEDAFKNFQGQALEFYTDATPEQLEWASSQRWIEHLTLYRTPFLVGVAKMLKASRGSRSAENVSSAVQVNRYAHPDDLPPEVCQFLTRAETRNVQFGLDWYRNLIDTVYYDHDGVSLYTLRTDDKLVAVLPLRIERGRFSWSAHSLSNFYSALYEPVLAPGTKAPDLLPLLRALRTDFPRMGSLMLSPMAPNSSAYIVLREALCLDRWFPFEFFAFGNWYEPVSSTWPEYMAAREGSIRSTVKRMGKKFAAEGGTLEVVTRPEDMPQAIAAYEKVYAASWKKPEPFQGFMPALLNSYANKGMLRLGMAWLHGEPIAGQVWIVANDRAQIYKVAYDEAFKEYSPGTLVTAMLVQHAMEVDHVSEIDYLIGDDPYKKTWMSERRERWGIVAYNLSTVPGMCGFILEAIGRIAKYLRNFVQGSAATVDTVQTLSKPSLTSTS